MFEHGLRRYHRRLPRYGARQSVVVRLGSFFFSNKNTPRGPLCSIEHDFLTFLPLSVRSLAGHTSYPIHLQRHAHPTHTPMGGLHSRVTGTTSPPDGDTASTQAPPVPPGDYRAPTPHSGASRLAALTNSTTSHRLHRSKYSRPAQPRPEPRAPPGSPTPTGSHGPTMRQDCSTGCQIPRSSTSCLLALVSRRRGGAPPPRHFSSASGV